MQFVNEELFISINYICAQYTVKPFNHTTYYNVIDCILDTNK